MQRRRVGKRRIGPIPIILLLCLLVTAGCSAPRYGTIIDWIDFVTINDTSYIGLSHGVLRDPNQVTQTVVGEVTQKLDGNITDSAYRSRSGDAAYLEKGTKLYAVTGFAPEELIATPDEQQIGGYKLYVREQSDKLPQEDFDAVLQANPSSVSIYRWGEVKPLQVLTGSESRTFLTYLQQAVHTPEYRANSQQDPAFYQVVLDTGEPVQVMFRLEDDGEQVRFREEYQVNDEIRKLLKP
ncbi:hypothetical protein B9G55_17095 [Saccharibacillus sp. O16]|nr:hypothetical protein B9G55_17095 [Saccharibacillus sp. O16]